MHESLTSNLCFDWGFLEDNKAAVDAAFETAHHVTTLELVNNRLVANAMEPRAAIGEYDPGTDEHTLFTTSQNPHVIRLVMGAFVLQHPGDQAAGGGAGRRRRLRLEDLPLRRGGLRHPRRAGARAAGEMDRPAGPRPSSPTRRAATT